MGFRPPLPCDLGIPFLVSQTFKKVKRALCFSAFKLLELLGGSFDEKRNQHLASSIE